MDIMFNKQYLYTKFTFRVTLKVHLKGIYLKLMTIISGPNKSKEMLPLLLCLHRETVFFNSFIKI